MAVREWTRMHELSIAASIVEIAGRHAAGRRVAKVTVKVGHLRQVVPSALAFSFEVLAQGTPVEGAELEIEAGPPIGAWRRCGGESPLPAVPLPCPAGGAGYPRVVAGARRGVGLRSRGGGGA